MKKVMVGVGLGLAAVSQAHAWNPGVQSVQSVQNIQATGVTNSHSTVVSRSRAAGTTHCRLPAGRTGGHVRCTNTHGQVVRQAQQKQVQQQRVVVPQRQIQQRQVPQRQPQRMSQQNHQRALQAQRAKRKAMFAVQAKRKAAMLAQQRKRAAMLEQQKRRKIQLAQQQARAAHQAAMLAAKKKRAALLIQQKRRAVQLAQQRRQQAQKRAALLAQQKQRAIAATQANSRQGVHNCPPVRVAQAQPKPVKRVVQQPRPVQRVAQQPRRVVQPQVQPRVTFSQQVINQREAVSNFQPREEIISRRIITTRVSPAQLANTQAVIQQAPRASSGQRFMQQSVDYHDRYRANGGWNVSQNVGAQHVRQHLASPAQQSVAHHEARVKQQRLQQIRTSQIAAQRRVASVKVKPAASTHTAASSQSAGHASGWQRQSTVHSHADNAYAMYKG